MNRLLKRFFKQIPITDYALNHIRSVLNQEQAVPVLVMMRHNTIDEQAVMELLHEHLKLNLEQFTTLHLHEPDRLPEKQVMSAIIRRGDILIAPLSRDNKIESDTSVFSELHELGNELNRELMLIPIHLVWNKYPRPLKRGATLSGVRRQRSNFYRLLRLLFRKRNATVEIGTPVPLNEFFTRRIERTEREKRVRASLYRILLRLERAVIGPPLRNRARTTMRVMRDRKLQEQVRDLAGSDTQKEERFWNQVQKILHEMSADFRTSTVIRFRKILDWAWPKVIEGFWIDEQGLEAYRVKSRQAPALLLPCHRSHADYLILSYLFHRYNLMIPFIAAGINLSFWPMGPIFRHSGAYFIRRSFKGDRLYPFVLEAYIRRILKDEIPQEFFPEGTRSRTGKMLHPKTGLLSFNLKTVRSGDVKDILIAPVSIVYGTLFESSSYLKEAQGETKQKESARSVLRTTRLLGKNFGKVYLSFGKAFFISEYTRERNVDLHALDDAEFRDFTTELGYDIVREIQHATRVTPIALLSLLFLSNIRKGMNHAGLMRRMKYAVRFLEERNVPMAEVSSKKEDTVLSVMHRLIEADRIQQLVVDGETVYRPVEESRSYLEYYKNNIVHLLVHISFVCASLLVEKRSAVSFASLRENYQFLHRLFYMEFIYDSHEPDDETIRRELQTLADMNLLELEKKKDTIHISADAVFVLRNIAAIILSYLEAYHTVLESYYSIARQNETIPPNIIPSIISRGHLLYTMGDITRRESINKFYYQTGHQWMNRSGLVNWQQLWPLLRRGRGHLSETEQEHITAYRQLMDQIKGYVSVINGP